MNLLAADPPPTRSRDGWCLDHSYTRLPAALHRACSPAPADAPGLVLFNSALAKDLGLDPSLGEHPSAAALFTGNPLPEGARPIAQAYAGHQFGNFTVLGDGRALLLGEQISPDGSRHDVQFKGSGPTPFSRNGDGRAALGPMLREYLISEAMHALGIPTTRSLAVATTGIPVFRSEMLRGAVLTRIAASHIRVGTFEWVAACERPETLNALVQYTLKRHFPAHSEAANPAAALLDAALESQASLLARWMQVGFVHGVMNTDNMALSGETIDYGPCAFMDRHNAGTVFSSIDRQGRYAYGRQPLVAQWNLARFAETLLPLLDPNPDTAVEFATEKVHGFARRYHAHWLDGYRLKLGFASPDPEDATLIQGVLDWMQNTGADHTHTFAALSRAEAQQCPPWQDPVFVEWHGRWKNRLASEAPERVSARMRAQNPVVIPRNHAVEAALQAAEAGDLGPCHRLLEGWNAPYDHSRSRPPELMNPPPAGTPPHRTFCGT